jgi:hypothetical protein
MMTASQMVDIDDLADVIILQDHFLGLDLRFLTAHIRGLPDRCGCRTKSAHVAVNTVEYENVQCSLLL